MQRITVLCDRCGEKIIERFTDRKYKLRKLEETNNLWKDVYVDIDLCPNCYQELELWIEKAERCKDGKDNRNREKSAT